MQKLVLFDLDGVLADLVKVHKDALNLALTVCGFAEISEADHGSIFNGLPTRVKLEMLNIPEADIEKVCNAKQHYTLLDIKRIIRPEREKIALMHTLKMRGYKLGCVTNSVRETVDLTLSLSFLDLFMDVVVSNEDVRNPKPAPDPYICALEELGAHSGIAIEDNEKGIRSAEAAGLTVIQVADPSEVNLGLCNRIVRLICE